ncbi:MAG TPA: hypothetical protein VNZ86_18580 [Bacteroidia bacterium]|jgi:hypothetical protein|nr:hypothetical protein [Bacteroidia bacterium]
MKNTTKLRHLLQLYTVSLDTDEDDRFHLTLFSKQRAGSVTFVDKAYTTVIGKAFSHMMKVMKEQK